MSDLVDWDLARRIATLGLGHEGGAMASAPDLAASGSRAVAAVRSYTGLEPVETLPDPEWVSRREWIDANLASVRDLTDAISDRIGDTPGPPPLRAIAARVLAAEVGALLAFAARHVLGQYEFPLLGGDRAPRLLFLGENIDAAAVQLGADPRELLDWIALHETTHAIQFASAPWMRGYVGGLVRTLLAESPVGFSAGDIVNRARRFATGDPRRILAEVRASDPLSLFAPAESVETINSVQAAMASIEGYAEHVMDAAGDELGPAVAAMRDRLDHRRRNRSLPARLLSWLFGFDLKLRQYEQGKRFCDAVVAEADIDGLNAAWNGPAELPAIDELADPRRWAARVLPTPAAA
ncbi:MAG: zinc-dependent metalloprotease [Solirubrobacterales bacterium]